MRRISLIWKIVLMCILLGVLLSMHFLVASYREDVTTLQNELTRRLVTTYAQSEIRSELDAYQQAVTQFEQYTISSPDEMLELVETIESQGSHENVAVEIPNIEELLPRTEQEVEEIIGNARIVILGRGQPQHLLAFLHRVEHLPYALVLEAWDLRANIRTEYTGEGGQALDVSEIVIEMRIPIRGTIAYEEN